MILLALPAYATTWVVDAAGGGDTTTIGDAIALAESGDAIEVRAGTYVEDVDFVGKALVLRGDGPDVTTIQGTGGGSVVRIASGEGEGTTLAGFTITGGDAGVETDYRGGGVYVDSAPVTLEDLRVVGNEAAVGGGVWVEWADTLAVRGCTFEGNEAQAGSGLFVYWTGATTLTGTRFTGNIAHAHADPGGWREGGYGAGFLGYWGAFDARDLSFTDNTAARGGGHVFLYSGADLTCARCTLDGGAAGFGGAVYVEHDSSLTLAGSTVSGNTADEFGGGIYLLSYSILTLRDVALTDNAARYGGALDVSGRSVVDAARVRIERNTGEVGGALYTDAYGDATLQNSVFVGNRASTRGGAIAAEGGSATVTASIFALDDAPLGGAVYVSGDDGWAAITNVTLTENTSAGAILDVATGGVIGVKNTIVASSPEGVALAMGADATAGLIYSDTWENAGGATTGIPDYESATNFEVDPRFVAFSADGAFADDLHLAAGSPLVDAGSPDLLDPDGTINDIGAFGGPAAGGWDDVDADVDGYTLPGGDCDDADPAVHPDTPDGCGAGDEDCDGAVDEDCGGDTGIGRDTAADTGPAPDSGSSPGTDTGPDPDEGGGEGCGCAAGSGAASWFGWVAPGLVVRRRRR